MREPYGHDRSLLTCWVVYRFRNMFAASNTSIANMVLVCGIRLSMITQSEIENKSMTTESYPVLRIIIGNRGELVTQLRMCIKSSYKRIDIW